MRYPWVNTLLLVLTLGQIGSGLAGLLSGSPRGAWVMAAHVAGAYAIGGLLVWKGAVVVRALRRRPGINLARVGFLLLTLLFLLTLASGFVWSHGGPAHLGGVSLLTLHGFLAVGTLLLLVWHGLAKRFIWRVARARDRRAFLRLGGASLVGLLLGRGEGPLQTRLGLAGAQRRFTGSYETGSFSGRFPHVVWLFDNPAPIQPEGWYLQIAGAVSRPQRLDLVHLLALPPREQVALLDCTGGWYSRQIWTGIPLVDLLALALPEADARSVSVESTTGYSRRFGLEEIEPFLLATGVAGKALDHGHGFPLRLVAPGRRGFEWVKWVVALRVSASSPHRQPPLPLQ